MSETLKERIEALKEVEYAEMTPNAFAQHVDALAAEVGELERGYNEVRAFRESETERCDFWIEKHDARQSVGVENRAFVARIGALEAALREISQLASGFHNSGKGDCGFGVLETIADEALAALPVEVSSD